MIKFKYFSMRDLDYNEQLEKFQNEHPNAEFIQITGGYKTPEKIWFKYDYGLNEQSKFTIPKRIADELDREGYIVTGGVMPRTWELEVQGTLEAVKRIAIARLYLIGKELGLNFVEVVEEPEEKYKCIECGLYYYYGGVRRTNYGYDYICDSCYEEEEG